MNYRPDIDGLRAIAVLLVVVYHANPAWLGGGFIGVDVFFVISGFLITRLLFDEWQGSQHISLSGFYARRVRRLLPALLLMLIGVLILGLWVLSPAIGEVQGLAQSTLATLALLSNHYFALNTGYFDEPAEQQVLLHTWSLSVEEQFYLLWPVLLLFLLRSAEQRKRSPRRLVLKALAALFVASLAASVWLTPREPTLAFFALPTRAWEFAVGGLASIALIGYRERPALGSVCSAIGLAGILACAIWIDASMAFPGAVAILPVAATGLVLIGGAMAPSGIATRVLRLKPLVAIGLVSYGWYLWHWPLLSLARIHGLGELDVLDAVAICSAALLLAALSYRFVEKPLRRPLPTGLTFRRGALAGFALALMTASAGAWAKWWWPRSTENLELRTALLGTEKVRVPCGQERPYRQINDRLACTFGGTDAGVVLWGDSHAAHFLPALALAQHEPVLVRYMPECPPILDYSPSLVGIERSIGCERFNRDVLDEILRHGPAKVVLAARWRAYLSNDAAIDAASEGLKHLATSLSTSGVRIVVMLPPPEMPSVAPACLIRRSVDKCSVDNAIAQRQRADASAMLQSALAGAVFVDPFPALCPGEVCAPLQDNTVLYSDAHHLSTAGSQRIAPALAAALR